MTVSLRSHFPSSSASEGEDFLERCWELPGPDDVSKDADANCEAAIEPSEVDNGSSDPNNDSLTLFLVPEGPYARGETAVTLVAFDGELAAVCSATITVEDKTAPQITCQNMTVNAASGQCATTVQFTAQATDACDPNPAVTCSPASGSSFQVGETTVTCTAKDAAGNKSECTFTVTVVDQQAPTLTCKDATITLDANGNASISESDVVDSKSDDCRTVIVQLSRTSFTCAE